MNRVAARASWADRFSAVESLVAERLADADLPASIHFAWRKLVAADGRIPVAALASDVGCSHRTLIARFHACVGLPPKTAARLLRFNRVVRALHRRSRMRADEPVGKPFIETTQVEDHFVCSIRWADLAADCGYVDQAHLIKEFWEFAGSTPDAFLRQVSFVA